MACASNPDELVLKRKNPMHCIPINKLLQSNSPLVDLSLSYLSCDKAGFSAVLKFATSRNFKTLPDICTFLQIDPTKPYQDQLSEAYPVKTLPSTENSSKETSAVRYSRSERKTIVKNASSNGKYPLREETALTGKSCLSFSQEIGSYGKIPVPIDVSKSMDSEKTLPSTENLSKETSDMHYLRSERKPTAKNVSSNGNLLSDETVLTGKSCLSLSQDLGSNGNIPVPIDVSKSVDSKKAFPLTENLSTETSTVSYSRSKRKPIVKDASSNGKYPLREETALTGKSCLSFSQDIGYNGKIPVPTDVSESMDETKFLISTSDAKLNPPVSDGDINVLNSKEVSPVEFPFDKPNFETDTSLLIPEIIEIPGFHHDGEKRKREVNLRSFLSALTKKPYDGDVITCPSAPRSSDKSLKETLPVLEDWAKRGLDSVFNRPLKFSSEEVGTNLENELKYGLAVMKEITTRMNTLIRAANQLLDIDPKLAPRYQSIRIDLNLNFAEMRNIVDDIKLQIYEDYINLKLDCDNVSGKDTEDTKQGAKSEVFVINAYTVVIEKLPVLRKQVVDIRGKIRIICSEIERFL